MGCVLQLPLISWCQYVTRTVGRKKLTLRWALLFARHLFKFKVEFVISPAESGQRPDRIGVTVMKKSGAGLTSTVAWKLKVDASQWLWLKKPPAAAWAMENKTEMRSAENNLVILIPCSRVFSCFLLRYVVSSWLVLSCFVVERGWTWAGTELF